MASNAATDNDMAALLGALPRLHTFSYVGLPEGLSPDALCVIGAVAASMRSIELSCHLTLPPAPTAEQKPLFPRLESLTLIPPGPSLRRFW